MAVFITIWRLIVSNLEETNLTRRLRMHGPKINNYCSQGIEGGARLEMVAKI
jgi:hypothetical protein